MRDALHDVRVVTLCLFINGDAALNTSILRNAFPAARAPRFLFCVVSLSVNNVFIESETPSHCVNMRVDYDA